MQAATVVRADEGRLMRVLGDTIVAKHVAHEPGADWAFFDMSVPKDSGPPEHTHPWAEAFYVLSGSFVVVIAGAAHDLGPGDYVYLPADTPHRFQGTSDNQARVLVWVSPCGAERFFADMDAEVRRMPEIACQ
jgi:quercetin dioxygenase-like cupin family protein